MLDGNSNQQDGNSNQQNDSANSQGENAGPPSGGALDLNEEQQEQVRKRTAPPAAVVYEAIRREGEEELCRPTSALAWSGLAAGLSMGFSMVAEGLLRASLPDEPWTPLIARLGYSVGFLIVILGRQQLFTENTLTPILPLMKRRDSATFWQVLRLWGVVLLANLVGAFIFAWVVGNTGVFEPHVKSQFTELGRHALGSDFFNTLLRGVFAGWLIALMVWLLPAAQAARVSIIVIITFLVGLAGLAHIIAGSVEVLYLVTTGQESILTYFLSFMLPALLGNILGGTALVAALNHAQVVSGDETRQ